MSRNWLSPRVLALVAVLPLVSVAPGSLTVASPATGLLTLDAGQVLRAAEGGVFALTLAGVPYVFDVAPNPIAEGALIGVDGVPVGHVAHTVTFVGTANGHDAVVAATQAGVWIVVLGPDPLIVEPLWLTQPDAPLGHHRAVWWSQNPPVIPDHPDPAPEGVQSNPAYDAAEVVLPRNRTVQFLVENDAAFHERFSLANTCSLCWVEVQQAVLAIAELNFRRDALVRFNITSQWTCTTVAACPYTVSGGPGDMGVWLGAFEDRWEGVTTEPAHDLGHLLSATNLPGGLGLAPEGVVGTSDGYAISEFGTLTDVNGVAHYVVATHEIGHNFDATHDRAAPIPPALGFVPPAGHGQAWTVMAPGKIVAFQFSDGSLEAYRNNRDRILEHAADRLPT